MTTVQERRDLRTAGRRARRGVVGAERARAEQAMLGHLRTIHALSNAPVVSLYMADDGEPDLVPMADELRDRDRCVALPAIIGPQGERSMVFRRWESGDELTVGALGIPCPAGTGDRGGGVVVPTVALVPLVRFDRHGNRLGRGGGFYDRYLATHRPLAVGVAFEIQRASSLPVASHDVPLDLVVTELGVRFMRNPAQNRAEPVGFDKDDNPCE